MVSGFDEAVLPGQEGKVTLAVDTTNLRGAVSKGARVEWSDPKLPAVSLILAGRIHEPVQLQPHYMLIEGFPGQRKKATVEIINNEEAPLRIAAVRSDRPDIKPALEEQQPGRRYGLTVEQELGARPGSFRGSLELILEETAGANLRIPVTVIVKRKVALNRGAVVLRGQPPGSPPLPVTVIVQKYGDKNFVVKNLACDLPFVNVQMVALPYQDDVAAYELRFTLIEEGRPAGPFEGKATFETNDAEFPRFTLPVRGPGRVAGGAPAPVRAAGQ